MPPSPKKLLFNVGGAKVSPLYCVEGDLVVAFQITLINMFFNDSAHGKAMATNYWLASSR